MHRIVNDAHNCLFYIQWLHAGSAWSLVIHHMFLQTFRCPRSRRRMLRIAATRATVLAKSLATVATIPLPRCWGKKELHQKSSTNAGGQSSGWLDGACAGLAATGCISFCTHTRPSPGGRGIPPPGSRAASASASQAQRRTGSGTLQSPA